MGICKKVGKILLIFFFLTVCSANAEEIIRGLMPGNSFINGTVYTTPENNLYFEVMQTFDDGIMVAPRPESFPLYLQPKNFFIKTSRKLADSDLLPSNLCLKYNGLIKYENVLNSISTIPEFKEVTCPISKAVLPPEKGENSQMVFDQWVDFPEPSPFFNSKTHVQVRRLYKNEIAIDTERWQPLLNTGPWSLFFDKTTVLKTIKYYNYPPDPSTLPLTYTFWMKVFLNEPDPKGISDNFRIITNATQHIVDCQLKTFNGHVIAPESKQEVFYNFFCQSEDAKKTKISHAPGSGLFQSASSLFH